MSLNILFDQFGLEKTRLGNFKMSISRLKTILYQKVAKFAFFTKGLVHNLGQRFEVSSPCFF